MQLNKAWLQGGYVASIHSDDDQKHNITVLKPNVDMKGTELLKQQ